MKRYFTPFLLGLSILVYAPLAFAQFDEVCRLEKNIVGTQQNQLEAEREKLLTKQIAVISKGSAFNQRCQSVVEGTTAYHDCVADHDSLLRQREELNAEIRLFCEKAGNLSLKISQDALFQKLYRQSLAGYQALQKKAENKDWSATIKTNFLIGILRAVRGQYERALDSLSIARTLDSTDLLIQEADDLFLTRMMEDYAHYTKRHPPPSKLPLSFRRSSQETHSLITRASLLLGQGDFDLALTLFKRAQSSAQGQAGTQSALNDALVWTRQLMEKAKENLDPIRFNRSYKRQAEQAAGEQAWSLGYALALGGDIKSAQYYYRRASNHFKNGNLEISKTFVTQQQTLANGSFSVTPHLVEVMATPKSKAEALLDALEYGKGDWNASINYLRDRRRLLPHDRMLEEAEKDLVNLYIDR